jgi:membrane protein
MFPPLRLKAALRLGGLTTRELMVRTWRAIEEHEIQTRAAGVAFYAMLALVPFIGLVLTFAVQFLPDITGGNAEVRGATDRAVVKLQETLDAGLPAEASREIQAQIQRIQDNPPFGLISIGLVITLWLASSLYLAVIDAMNRIYGVTERRSFLKLRLVAIAMTITQAAILVGSLLVIVAWPYILRWLGLGSVGSALVTVAQFGIVLLMVLISFALTFYVAPDADQSWEWITPGSLFGSVVFVASTFLFRVYVHNFANYDRTYGPLGGVMVLLFWFWMSALVLLSAGQMNKIIEEASPLGKDYGQRENPAEMPDFSKMEPEVAG